MSGFPDDTGWKGRDNRDNGLRSLLVALAVLAGIAASVIAFAYASSNGQVSDGMSGEMRNSPEVKFTEKVVDDSEKEIKKPVYRDMTEYIDSLLSNIDNHQIYSEPADSPDDIPPVERADMPNDTPTSEPPDTPVWQPIDQTSDDPVDSPDADTTNEGPADSPDDAPTTEPNDAPAEESIYDPAGRVTNDSVSDTEPVGTITNGTASDGQTILEDTLLPSWELG